MGEPDIGQMRQYLQAEMGRAGAEPTEVPDAT